MAARLLRLDSAPHRPDRCSTQLRNSRSDKRRQRRCCYFSGCWLLGRTQDVLEYHGKSWQATQDPDGDGSSRLFCNELLSNRQSSRGSFLLTQQPMEGDFWPLPNIHIAVLISPKPKLGLFENDNSHSPKLVLKV